MKNEYISINGKLESMTKKDAKDKIIKAGGNFQQDINTKTTIVVEAQEPLKKKKNKIKQLRKNDQEITVINEEEFLNLLAPKKAKKEVPEYVNKENILRILAILILAIFLGKMNSIQTKVAVILAAISVLPKVSGKFYNHIVFKIVIPVALIMYAFTFNNDAKLSQVYGTWYIDTLTLYIDKNKAEIDVIDNEGRHMLKGTGETKNNKVIIKTDYKNYYFEYDNESDSLCYLKDKKTCSYYLKRIN